MVAKTYINDNGTWRTIRAIYVNDGTAWRTVKSQWVNDNGSWRQVHRGVFVYTETISTNTSNYDLRSKLTTAGWDGTQDVEATITVNPAVVVYSTTTPTAAFNINPALPPASTVSLTNQGTIVGKAGTGGKGGSYNETPSSAVVGNAGGSGLYTSSPITINNTGGTIAGGGGGGGGGGYAFGTYSLGITYIAGGSGGGGGGGSISPGGSPTPGGDGGVGIIPPATPAPSAALYRAANGTTGSTGTNVAGGLTPGVTTSTHPSFPTVTVTSGAGGAGGSRGNSGSTGGDGSTNPGPAPQWAVRDLPAGAAGGASGAAISGNPLVTLPAPQTGTISGPRV
jgi:hypothetical protein